MRILIVEGDVQRAEAVRAAVPGRDAVRSALGHMYVRQSVAIRY